MALSQEQVTEIEEILRTNLRSKFEKYSPEPASMPFHTRLLGKDRLALYSFIHSLSTRFGASVFEPIALALAQQEHKDARLQETVGNKISISAREEIQNIMDELATEKNFPDKKQEIKRIRRVCRKGEMIGVKPTKVDLMFKSKSGEYFLFDIKTAKPNTGGFKELKRTLLEWAAVMLANDPEARINTMVAIPYNPYQPQPYSRWTGKKTLDFVNDLKVANEFWDFLGGAGTYEELLDCFERVGIELGDEIERYFKRFK